MPRKANRTSFQPGHQRSAESIEKQRETLKQRYAAGELTPPAVPWTPERKAKHAATKRQRALGSITYAKRGDKTYRVVMTIDGQRYEHRVIMERLIGRPLLRSEHVHHINGDGLDNRPENLKLLSGADHNRHHHTGHPPVFRGCGSMLAGRWSRKHDACLDCGRVESPHVARGLCHPCYEKRRRHQ